MKVEDPGCMLPNSAPPRSDQPQALVRSKILVVAAPMTTAALLDLLRPEGFLLADSAPASVLEACITFAPDLVLVEFEALGADPEEFGFTLAERCRSRPPALVAIAADADVVDVTEFVTAGAVDVVFQPFRGPEVLARVRLHLAARARELQGADEERAQNRLLCMAAHDLRNPLVSIRALTNLVRAGTAGGITAAQRDLLDTIYDASQSMLDLVNELLDATVQHAGEVKLMAKPVAFAELVESCVKLANATAGEKASRIVLEPGQGPAEILLDEPKIRQVLNNVLGNAIKFSPPGSTITVSTASNDFECSVTVRDQGPGIREGERDRLFKDFSRAAAKPTGGESSTGLGLAICRKIMQAHAGTIEVANAPEGGAVFRIALPILP